MDPAGSTDPPGMPQLAGVRHRWVELPGLRLHVAEAGAGDPVVLLHGFPQHWWEWRHVIAPLGRTHHVIAPDLRGAGWTEASAGRIGPQQLVDDVLALFDVLGIASPDVVAHDYSVLTAYRLAFDHPERVRSLVCLGPHPFMRFHPSMLAAAPGLWFQPVVAAPGLGRWALAHTGLTEHLLAGARPGSLTATDRRTFGERARVHASAGSELYRRVILPEARRLVSGVYRGRHLRVPTRALAGALEPGVGAAVVAVPEGVADDLRAELVPGAGHFLADDRPDVVVATALELLVTADR